MKPIVFRGILIVLALIFSSACYLYGLFKPVPGSVYTGIRSLNASDYNVNLSWIDQSRKGTFFLRNLYDSREQEGFLIRPLYFLLSVPFRFVPASNTLALHILRLIGGLCLLLALFRQLKAFEPDDRVVMTAFALLAFTSGAGILFGKWLPDSADLWIPECSLFLTLGEAPHFVFSLLLLWIGIAGFYRAIIGKGGLTPVLLALAFLWWEHPFDAIILAAVTGANFWQLPRLQKLNYLIGSFLVSILPILYYWHLRTNPAFESWEAQNILPTPSILSLICGFLPLVLFGIWGVFQKKEHRRLLSFLLVWIFVQFVLAYLPFKFQRRLLFGVQFPLALLSAFALNTLKRPIWIAMIVLICSATSIQTIGQQISEIRIKGMPYYLPSVYREAFDWLSGKQDQGAVLSGFVTGNFIPGYTGHPVFLGHSVQTPQIALRKQQAVQFFLNPDRTLLRDYSIQYIFCGFEEGHANRLEGNFPKVYEKGGIMIFQAANSLSATAPLR